VELLNSGTTAVVALRRDGEEDVWVATLGDSRAILFGAKSGILMETQDHSPSREDEATRIRNSGGQVVSLKWKDGFVSKHVSTKEGHTLLRVTRSLGDGCLKECGVTAEPEVTCWSINKDDDPYLLLGSDGIFEHLSSKRVVGILSVALFGQGLEDVADASGALRVDTALQTLLEEAQKAWSVDANSNGVYCDDISAILVPAVSKSLPHLDAPLEQRQVLTA
jgi:serine/threonine protein phosphatase PrpC